MRKPEDLPFAVKDKFLCLDRVTCNGIMYDDMSNPDVREKFRLNDGKYCSNNGLTAVIIGNQIYVTPFRDVVEILEAYGFERGSFTVPFSVDVYNDYPNAMGPETEAKIAANHLEDPVGALMNAQEMVFTQSTKFRKWNELLKQATRKEGSEIDLVRYHRTVNRQMYVGEENAERRAKRNAGLREMVREFFPGDEKLMQRINEIEKRELTPTGRFRR